MKPKSSCSRSDTGETRSQSPEETSQPTTTPSKELQDSLVDMYTANPRVNVELRQRLPALIRTQLISSNGSEISLSPDLNYDHHTWPRVPQHLQEPSTSCSPPPPSYRRSASPLSPPPCRKSVSPLSSSRLGGAGEMEVDLSTSRGLSPRAKSCGDTADEGGAPGDPASPSLGRHLATAVDSSASARPPSADRDKNISLLLKELDALRQVNNKLQQQLVQKEKELHRREVEEELREKRREARDWERPAAVLEEVLAAQKDRDQAVMSRLLLANEERDEALLRLHRLQQAAESECFHLDDGDQDVDELLRHICDADSVQEIEQLGSVLVQRLWLARQRRSDITAQEMKAVMEERDSSTAKWKRLEQEREQQASEELQKVQMERDGALEDRRRLGAEVRALRANHRSQDLAPPSQPSLRADSVSPEAPPLMDKLQQLMKEKQSVEAELQRCQEAEREATEQVRRLERLVEVLRKKVGTGSVRAVI
ncbi:mirror-image polydactyly gene 1 protein [Simochromis diagramma]|uniref:mirror-image polydactyly gene 1 protein n=1 Tax=Simochromis diagramma TaxID=43689 RepID=UPI001A7F085F|nr:mirror-image polydactyly gene 1 protein [Simochromis diagramma]